MCDKVTAAGMRLTLTPACSRVHRSYAINTTNTSHSSAVHI